jgi:hypothetical protein
VELKIFIGAGCRTGVDVGVGAEFGNIVVGAGAGVEKTLGGGGGT